MVIFAVLCILLGVAPELLYRYLPYPVEYEAYTPGKVLFYLQLLLFSGLAFFLLLPLMKRTQTISLDTDWIWRRLLFGLGNRTWSLAAGTGRAIGARVDAALEALRGRAAGILGTPDKGQLPGVFARTWSIGVTALWIAVLLTGYVLIYYV